MNIVASVDVSSMCACGHNQGRHYFIGAISNLRLEKAEMHPQDPDVATFTFRAYLPPMRCIAEGCECEDFNAVVYDNAFMINGKSVVVAGRFIYFRCSGCGHSMRFDAGQEIPLDRVQEVREDVSRKPCKCADG